MEVEEEDDDEKELDIFVSLSCDKIINKESEEPLDIDFEIACVDEDISLPLQEDDHVMTYEGEDEQEEENNDLPIGLLSALKKDAVEAQQRKTGMQCIAEPHSTSSPAACTATSFEAVPTAYPLVPTAYEARPTLHKTNPAAFEPSSAAYHADPAKNQAVPANHQTSPSAHGPIIDAHRMSSSDDQAPTHLVPPTAYVKTPAGRQTIGESNEGVLAAVPAMCQPISTTNKTDPAHHQITSAARQMQPTAHLMTSAMTELNPAAHWSATAAQQEAPTAFQEAPTAIQKPKTAVSSLNPVTTSITPAAHLSTLSAQAATAAQREAPTAFPKAPTAIQGPQSTLNPSTTSITPAAHLSTLSAQAATAAQQEAPTAFPKAPTAIQGPLRTLNPVTTSITPASISSPSTLPADQNVQGTPPTSPLGFDSGYSSRLSPEIGKPLPKDFVPAIKGGALKDLILGNSQPLEEDEWSCIERKFIVPGEGQLNSSFEAPPDTVKAQPVITCEEVLEHFQSADMSDIKPKILLTVERRGFSAWAHYLFGPPKLRNNLLPAKELTFCMAATTFENTNTIHVRSLMSVFRNLTGVKVDCQRYGNHWEKIGFQGTDPSTDLRGVGVFGLLQLLYFTSQPKLDTLKKQVYQLSQHKTQNFPFCVLGLNLSKLILQLLREDKLNRLCNKRDDLVSVVNDTFAAMYFKIYHIWKSQNKTIIDSGFVLKDVESLVRKSPQNLIKELEEFLHNPNILAVPSSSRWNKFSRSTQSADKMDDFVGLADIK